MKSSKSSKSSKLSIAVIALFAFAFFAAPAADAQFGGASDKAKNKVKDKTESAKGKTAASSPDAKNNGGAEPMPCRVTLKNGSVTKIEQVYFP